MKASSKMVSIVTVDDYNLLMVCIMYVLLWFPVRSLGA